MFCGFLFAKEPELLLEEDLADEGIHLGTSQQISPTEWDTVNGAKDTQHSLHKHSSQQIFPTQENIVNGAEETQHADMYATESQTIRSERLD